MRVSLNWKNAKARLPCTTGVSQIFKLYPKLDGFFQGVEHRSEYC